jgi:nucleotide-binding universal stress UspA family protein
MIKITNVLVATDFGPASESALNYGREIARTFGSKLRVLHVVENPMMMAGPDAVAVDLTRVQADLEAMARTTLDRIVTDEDRIQLGAVADIRTGTSPALEIVAHAREQGVDIIVIGTHGRGPLKHLLMGNVAEKVVRLAPCPVLTVRHPEHEFIAPDALQAVTTRRL